MEFTIPLNKFEKEEKVVELHKQGRTIRKITPIVHISLGIFLKDKAIWKNQQETKKGNDNKN